MSNITMNSCIINNTNLLSVLSRYYQSGFAALQRPMICNHWMILDEVDGIFPQNSRPSRLMLNPGRLLPYRVRLRQITPCNTNRDLDIMLTLLEVFHFFPSALHSVKCIARVQHYFL